MNNFRDRQGEGYTPEDLELLCKALIKSDIINFPIKKEMSAGFTSALAWKIVERIKLVETGKYLVINDISLQVANVLVSLGVNPKNIYLAYGKWTKKAEPDTDPTLYLLMKQYIKANIVETFNIIKLEEIFTLGTKFDGIIANPPYGKIGAQITETIITTVEFDTYIDLEPAVDFLKFPNIYNHMKLDETSIVEGFGEGAHVLPSIFTFDKHINNNITAEEFFVYTVSNTLTNKYFFENIINRKAYDSITFDEDTTVQKLDFSKRLIFGIKICSNAANHLDKTGINVGGTYKSTPYKINKQELTLDDYYQTKKSKAFWGVILTFKSEVERTNAFNFSYSKDGFKFLNLLAHSMRRDNFHVKEYMALFPKVDWTRAWTVEEILEDYGYTEAEINAVMTDLVNFKGMED